MWLVLSIGDYLHLLLCGFYEVGQGLDDFVFGVLHRLSQQVLVSQFHLLLGLNQLLNLLLPLQDELIESLFVLHQFGDVQVLLLHLLVKAGVGGQLGLGIF